MTENISCIITDIDDNLGKLAEGNLNLSAKVEYYGDFITIRNSIHKIADSLNHTLGKINQSANEVSSRHEVYQIVLPKILIS